MSKYYNYIAGFLFLVLGIGSFITGLTWQAGNKIQLLGFGTLLVLYSISNLYRGYAQNKK